MMRTRIAKDYGVLLIDGPLGITTRAVVTISKDNKISPELVSEIANEPNYQAALDSISNN